MSSSRIWLKARAYNRYRNCRMLRGRVSLILRISLRRLGNKIGNHRMNLNYNPCLINHLGVCKNQKKHAKVSLQISNASIHTQRIQLVQNLWILSNCLHFLTWKKIRPRSWIWLKGMMTFLRSLSRVTVMSKPITHLSRNQPRWWKSRSLRSSHKKFQWRELPTKSDEDSWAS